MTLMTKYASAPMSPNTECTDPNCHAICCDADGKRVESGSQIDIGHHYESVARDQFDLLRNSPVRYTPPEDR